MIRYVRSDIPPFDTLELPPVLLELVMEKRGLMLVAGATGSGKSTTLAAMIDHRNADAPGHILTIEDPIEFLFQHKKSIVNQRELGIDTQTYRTRWTTRCAQAPDLIMIGEIRDQRDDAARRCLRAVRPPVPGDAARQQQLPRAVADHQPLPARPRPRLLSDLSTACARSSRSAWCRTPRAASCSRRWRSCSTPAHRRAHQERRDHADQGSDGEDPRPGLADVRAVAVPLYLDGTITYDEAMRARRLADQPRCG